MPTLDKINPNEGFFGLFVGKPGGGKSSAELTFPGRTKLYDYDGRARGAQWTDAIGVNLSNIDVTFVPPVKGYKDIADEVDSIVTQVAARKYPFQNIVFDSLTSLTNLLITDAMRIIQVGKKSNDESAGGRMIGNLRVEGMSDYKYESRAMKTIFDAVRPLTLYGINVLFSAHVLPIFGKEDPHDPMSPTVVTGRTLALRDKLAVNLDIYFDEVYEFIKVDSKTRPLYKVKFNSDLARTTYRKLPKGEVDITDKNFYNVWKELRG